MAKLTKTMREALAVLGRRPEVSAYSAGVSVATLYALQRRRFAIAVGSGHVAFPANGRWRITDAGRAALQSHNEGSDGK